MALFKEVGGNKRVVIQVSMSTDGDGCAIDGFTRFEALVGRADSSTRLSARWFWRIKDDKQKALRQTDRLRCSPPFLGIVGNRSG